MIYVVLGMHRSGTSAIAGLLHTNGISMGETGSFLPRPSSENPKGFFEDVRFREINDEVLACWGYRVSSWDLPPDAPYDHAPRCLFDRAVALVMKRHEEDPSWGWKDPRTCLVFSFWARVLDSVNLLTTTRVIGLMRSSEDIAASMRRRGNPGSMDQFVELTRCYERGIRLARPDVWLHFDESPEILQHKLKSMLYLDLPDLSIIDQSLRNRS